MKVAIIVAGNVGGALALGWAKAGHEVIIGAKNPDSDKVKKVTVQNSSIKGKQIASQLAKDAGFAECYDFGGDDKVALLVQFALAWINLSIFQKQGRNIAMKVIKR